jgi:hypothetical protein
MKFRILVSGNDGSKPVKPDDVIERDSDWARRMLVNGCAEPLDEAAKSVVANKDQIARYRSNVLIRVAQGRKVPDEKIPALGSGGAPKKASTKKARAK